MTVVGWILLRTRSLARRRSSLAISTTEVVPSPTSLSCCVARETRMRAWRRGQRGSRCQRIITAPRRARVVRRLTAGCATSSRDRIVAPSLVIVTSPTLSTSILSSLPPDAHTRSAQLGPASVVWRPCSPHRPERRLEDVGHGLACDHCMSHAPSALHNELGKATDAPF